MKNASLVFIAIVASFMGGIIFAKYNITPKEVTSVVYEAPKECKELLKNLDDHITLYSSVVDLASKKVDSNDWKAFKSMDASLAEESSELMIRCDFNG